MAYISADSDVYSCLIGNEGTIDINNCIGSSPVVSKCTIANNGSLSACIATSDIPQRLGGEGITIDSSNNYAYVCNIRSRIICM